MSTHFYVYNCHFYSFIYMYINLIIYFSPPQKQPRRHPNQKSSSFGTEEQRRIRNYIDAFDDFAAVLLNNEHR